MNLNRFCYLLLGLAAISSYFLPHPLVMWFLLVNLLTFVIYGMDKMGARRAWRRISEVTLLAFGLVGGWVGAILAQQTFRHKTQKQPFKVYFWVSVGLSVLGLWVLSWGFFFVNLCLRQEYKFKCKIFLSTYSAKYCY